MRAPTYVLGVDLGTSACKVCLASPAGTVAGEARAEYPTHSPHPLWAEQDPEAWLPALAIATRQVLAQCGVAAAQVAGIALTSAAHIGVLLDARGTPVRPALLWNDQRSAAEVADLEREAGGEILRLTYQAVSTTWTLPHLLWVRRHEPDAWARARTLLLSKDYLVWQLTGEKVTDPATALSSQLYDVAAGAWSPALCDLAGISPAMLPEIRPPTAAAGRLTERAAEALQLAPGTPVVNGTLDSATELLAAGVCRPGQGMVRLATAGGVQMVVPGPTPHRQRITYPHPVAPFWYCQAGTNTCAAAVRWGADLLAGEGDLPFESWDALAASAPAGADGLLFHPYLAGERAPHWDSQLRGSFVGATLHYGRGHFARAIYEGTAFSIRQAMSALPESAAGTDPLVVAGGGARSALWMRILADVLARPLRVAAGADSAHGAALLGIAGLGLANAMDMAAPHTEPSLVFPDATGVALYDRWFGAYVAVHEHLAPLYHDPDGPWGSSLRRQS